jgi:adenylate cyclase
MGIHYWLRVKPWHRVTIPTLRVLGLLVPLVAIGGFVDMGQELGQLAVDPEWARSALVPTDPAISRLVGTVQVAAVVGYLAIVGLVFLARGVRTVWQRRLGVARLTYPDGRQVRITPGTTVLEASRAAGIPHASLCGGRGRCSTCRTRLVGPLAVLPKPSTDEARVLRRIGAPPDVRLACQLRPSVDLLVFPLLPPAGDLPANPLRPSAAQGTEQDIAILFADLRGFTTFSEQRLPYDVVFVLNQYFAAMGDAVEQSGGYLDKFVGDGVMALFGLHGDPGRGCLEAMRAAVAMAEALDTLNRTLAADLAEPLRIGIGIHVGSAIVGEMGHRRARSLTAVGDAVNIASRLESLTKEYGAQLVLSDEVARRAGVDLGALPAFDVDIRGRTAPLLVRVAGRAGDLAPVLSAHPS